MFCGDIKTLFLAAREKVANLPAIVDYPPPVACGYVAAVGNPRPPYRQNCLKRQILEHIFGVYPAGWNKANAKMLIRGI